MQIQCATVEIIGDQRKVSESQFTGAESNLSHLSNSIGNQQELPQTSIKLICLYTSLWQSLPLSSLTNGSRDPVNSPTTGLGVEVIIHKIHLF